MRLLVDGVEHEFNASRITNVEGMAIEKVTGMLYKEWAEALDKGSMLARTALVWVVRKRAEPALRFDDVEFSSLELVPEEEPDPKGEADEDSTPTA